MHTEEYSIDIEKALSTLKSSGIILYPTDTIWGIGCDATNEEAIHKVYKLKKRPDKKALVILLSEAEDIGKYAKPDESILSYLDSTSKPTTVIYKNAMNLPPSLLGEDNTIAIRIVKDPFCEELIRLFMGPLVSTSANLSGEPSPNHFGEISSYIKKGVDYIVKYRQNETIRYQPSTIIRSNEEGGIEILR